MDSVEKFEQDVATPGLDGRKVVHALVLGKFSSSSFFKRAGGGLLEQLGISAEGWRD